MYTSEQAKPSAVFDVVGSNWNLSLSINTHQGVDDVSGDYHSPLLANTGFLPNVHPDITWSEERAEELKG